MITTKTTLPATMPPIAPPDNVLPLDDGDDVADDVADDDEVGGEVDDAVVLSVVVGLFVIEATYRCQQLHFCFIFEKNRPTSNCICAIFGVYRHSSG